MQDKQPVRESDGQREERLDPAAQRQLAPPEWHQQPQEHNGHSGIAHGQAAEADQPAQYDSPPESIELARETMRDIKAALTRGTDGEFPVTYAGLDWDGMNMQPPKTAWQDMDIGERYDLLLHALDESIWDIEKRDSQKLALEFVKDEERQLHAEMCHDYGLRFLENRLVSYEDTTERPLDHAAGDGKGEGQENTREVSPADLTESIDPASQQGQQQTQRHGIRM